MALEIGTSLSSPTPLTNGGGVDNQSNPLGGSNTGAPGTGFRSVFSNRFTNAMDSLLGDALNGAFDPDQSLVEKAASIQQRIAAAQAAGGASGVLGGGPAADAGLAAGAGAAPTADAVTGASYASDERELLDTYRLQAENRLRKVSDSLNNRLDGAKQLPSAANGLDYHNYQPKDEVDAENFAERLAVDLTVGAAKLEVIATQLDLARHDAANAKTASAKQDAKLAVDALEEQFERQQLYVLDLADVVDQISGDGVSDIEAGPNSAQLNNVIETAVGEGATKEEVDQLRKLHSLVKEEADTGNSTKLNTLNEKLIKAIFDHWNKVDDQKAEQAERDAEIAREDKRFLEKYQDKKATLARWDANYAQRQAEQEAYLRV